MNEKEKLLSEFDRIIEVGIVNAHHDRDVLKAIRKRLKDQEQYIKELQDKLWLLEFGDQGTFQNVLMSAT